MLYLLDQIIPSSTTRIGSASSLNNNMMYYFLINYSSFDFQDSFQTLHLLQTNLKFTLFVMVGGYYNHGWVQRWRAGLTETKANSAFYIKLSLGIGLG